MSDTKPYERALERIAIDGMPLDAALRGRLAAFAHRLAEANARTNLTAARTPEALAAHIEDSLRLVPHLGADLVDVGSGGGFPAIPLAIVTGRPILLVESAGKKARFLEETARGLGLDCTVTSDRAEVAARDARFREAWTTATARAVAGITVVLELTMPFLAIGGRALLQRGRTSEAERQSLADAALVLGGHVLEEISGPDERRVFVVVKERPSGNRFPRRSGIPDRRPLCVAGGAEAPSDRSDRDALELGA